ncbi:hypothetical protein D3C81_1692950 [compost metagenome]
MVELLGLVERFFGIGHRLDNMAAFGQAAVQVMTQQRLVFNDQQFHFILQALSQIP